MNTHFKSLVAGLFFAMAGLTATGVALISASVALAAEPEFASQCLGCHGAQKAEFAYQAPQLAKLKKNYIFTQLQGYRDGLRGLGSKEAGEMAAAVQGLDDQQLEAMASWAATLKGQALHTFDRNSSELGAVIFSDHCYGCHQAFMGRTMTKSPRLEYLDGGYMVAQIGLFSSGERRINQPNEHQAKMVDVVKALNEEQLTALNNYLLETSTTQK